VKYAIIHQRNISKLFHQPSSRLYYFRVLITNLANPVRL